MAWHDSSVIPCKWTRTPAGYCLWVKGHRDISGEGVEFEGAQDALIEAIMRAAPHCLELVVPEYDPPLPAPAAVQQFLVPELYLIWGDAIFDAPHSPDESPPHEDPAYAGGKCSECGHAKGARTPLTLKIDAGEYADSGFLRGYAHPEPQVFSDRFCSLLHADERESLVLRAVEFPSCRRGRKYFELIAAPVAPFVSIVGLDANGCECAACGWRSFSVFDPALNDAPHYLYEFVCVADLPKPLPSMFAVGSQDGWKLCVTRARLDEFRESKWTTGLASSRLGIVAEERCERRPRLARRGRRRDCAVCSNWPTPVNSIGEPHWVFKEGDFVVDDDSWNWLAGAQESGLIRVMRVTKPLSQMIELAQPGRVSSPEVFSFRCPECWRLGYVALTRSDLRFIWDY